MREQVLGAGIVDVARASVPDVDLFAADDIAQGGYGHLRSPRSFVGAGGAGKRKPNSSGFDSERAIMRVNPWPESRYGTILGVLPLRSRPIPVNMARWRVT
ncbi:hypothetical protein GCM10018793_68430 [Streptomyces sulfonofaciens]|uniref:Uncharacterized protein n=1 Tax=Streptomyces sulfonofaciens TaxID=68272 RepID=A0A919GPR6_9ACTN|nr:hypothetical protein GCM10018793_68430 [Streptomyces sulfonofaciens]